MTSIDNVQDITPLVRYVATSSQTAFTYPFPIFQDSDVIVDQDGVTLTLTTDYTVSGEGEDNGGTVTLVVGATTGDIITIYRDISVERDTDYLSNGPWSSTATNNEFDKIILILQELENRIGRCIRFPITSTTTNAEAEMTPESSYLGKFLKIAATGELTAAAVNTSDVVTAADQISLTDSGSDYLATDVEAAFAELASTTGAGIIGIADTNELYTAESVESALLNLARKHTTYYKTGEESVASSITVQGDNHITGIPLQTNGLYAITGVLKTNGNNGTGAGGLRFELAFSNAPQSGDVTYELIGIDGATVQDCTSSNGIGTESVVLNSTNNNGIVKVSGVFEANGATGGTLELQWAQQTSHSDDTSLDRLSYLTVSRLSL